MQWGMGVTLPSPVRRWGTVSGIVLLVLSAAVFKCVELTAQSPGVLSQPPPARGSTNSEAVDETQTGISLTSQGRFKEAIPHLLVATERGNRSFAVQFDLALCYVGTGQYDDAIKILKEVDARHPANANVHSLLAQAYVGSDRIEEAVEALHKSVALEPKNEKLYLLLGDACMDRGQYSLGLDVANLGLKQLSNSAGLLYQRGMFLTLLDQFDAGKLDLERAAELGRGREIAFLAAAQKASFEGNMADVARIAREGLKKYENEALLTMLGEALIRAGVEPGETEFGEAVAALEKSVALRPDVPNSRIALGKLYLMNSQLREAIGQLEAARQLDPSNTAVYSNLAKAYRRSGDQARTQQVLAVLSNLNQEQAEAIRSAPGERKSSYLGSRSKGSRPPSQPAVRESDNR